ncbi:hypothetical protein [Cellulomonas chengniuliangii]|uniref:hypothetical protein n=1 Tax=Cellulomonas chengniuliangii TaxID=2968084 RepID=UPI001D0E0F8C|nr:hypothetical protein [Cellulomonas chengniuliangii]MCC2318530.1 hypothetical protein [Cellulomonas chengniuliangii]
MQARSLVFGIGALIAVAAMAPSSVLSAPAVLFGPAYDASTASSVRNLAMAMHSALLFDDEEPVDSAADLAEWGWTPGEHLAVQIWVAGDHFRVEAQDVRPGASRFVYSSVDATGAAAEGVAGGAVARVEGSGGAALPDDPGVTLTRVMALPPA